jgi:hypothetical protein
MSDVTPRRLSAVLCLVALISIAGSRAASAQDRAELLLPTALFASAETADDSRPFDARLAPRITVEQLSPSRPAPLLGLYVSLAAFQALDIASTHRALKAGAVEANPVVAPFAHSPLALAAIKAGVTTATIFATEQLWKTNRKAAVLTMLAVNAAYGAIAAHNYKVSVAQRR